MEAHLQRYQFDGTPVSAVGVFDEEGNVLHHAMIWRRVIAGGEQSTSWSFAYNVDWDALQQKHQLNRFQGRAPAFVNSFLREGQLRFNCIWYGSPSVPPASATLRQFSNNWATPAGYAVVSVSCASLTYLPEDGVSAAAGDRCVSAHKPAADSIWTASFALNRQAFIARTGQLSANGYSLHNVQVDDDDNYSAVWVKDGQDQRYVIGISKLTDQTVSDIIESGFRMVALDTPDNMGSWTVIFHKMTERFVSFNVRPNLPFQIACLDEHISTFLNDYRIPGASIAVQQQGRGIYTQTYGVKDAPSSVASADAEEARLVDASTTFRLASLTKTVTAVAVVQLVQEGRLQFGDYVFADGGVLSHLLQTARAVTDTRIYEITVDHLLQHTAGWDRCISMDVMFRQDFVAATLGVSSPPTADQFIRFQLGESLDHAPGTTFAYSNFGYVLLGKIVERLTGVPFEEQVHSPMYLGRTVLGLQPQQETEYDPPAAYDSSEISLEALFTSAQLVGTPVQFLAWLKTIPVATKQLITERPAYLAEDALWWYGRGVYSRPDASMWHDGIMLGSAAAFSVDLHTERQFVIVVNKRIEELESYMRQAIACVLDDDDWPAAEKDGCPALLVGSCRPCFRYGQRRDRVDVSTLAELLSSWGPCAAAGGGCEADADCDDDVDVADLSEMLSKWGLLDSCQLQC